MSRWQWLLSKLSRRLWFRTTLIGTIGLLTAVLAAVLERYLPWEFNASVSVDAVDSLLTIIASSMLTVTTFSLSIMVSAYGSATNNVTPRATRLLIEDRLTQTVLANFVGSFLFGIGGLVLLKSGLYSEQGRIILFVATIGVIVMVVLSLLRWIDHLTRLGRLGETTNRVEEVARKAIEGRLERPCLGGVCLAPEAIPQHAEPVPGERIGYVQNVDMAALAALCKKYEVEVFLSGVPGTFVYPETVLARVYPVPAEEHRETIHKQLREAFLIGNDRSFEQDPRFGLIVMSEIALRALSPAVNDPGTAIDIIGRQTRLLMGWGSACAEQQPERAPLYDCIHVEALKADDLFEDAFMSTARDGAGLIEVQLRLQKALLTLSQVGDEDFRRAAVRHSKIALQRAEAGLPIEADRQRLRDLVRAQVRQIEQRG